MKNKIKASCYVIPPPVVEIADGLSEKEALQLKKRLEDKGLYKNWDIFLAGTVKKCNWRIEVRHHKTWVRRLKDPDKCYIVVGEEEE